MGSEPAFFALVTGEFVNLVVPGIGGGTTGTSYTLRLIQ